MYFTYNPPYVQSGSCFTYGSAKSYNYRNKKSKKLTKIFTGNAPNVESAITYNLGWPLFLGTLNLLFCYFNW